MYFYRYLSPLGGMTLAGTEDQLKALWFDGQKHRSLPEGAVLRLTPVLEQTVRWLETYFEGREPSSPPSLSPEGTEFQRRVWELLSEIPYGETVSYGLLAGRLSVSAQAVGGAVGRNPIAIIIPCHRVIGADGGLVGYSGGLSRKEALLSLEKTERIAVTRSDN